MRVEAATPAGWRPTGLHRVTVAASWLRQGFGLLGRRGLAAGEALWLEPCGSVHTLAMRFALDVAFIDASGRVLAVVEAAPAWRIIAAPWGTRAALEAAAGALRDGGIVAGCTLRLAPSYAR
ncbi:MAG: DUF192 domain-containing protein [Armatimonadetes bacterium]|nr:DUF192 domain-containing protein [Armatimonadota bacterium]